MVTAMRARPPTLFESARMSELHRVTLPGFDTTLEADRLRRDRGELIGELSVRCGLPGGIAVNGYLSVADFNFSSTRARTERAKLLKERAKTNGQPDWLSALEDLCQRVIQAERTGDPPVD